MATAIGIENFRDFGGYGTKSGRQLRTNTLYRSADQSRASDLDLARLDSLGISLLVDLRRKSERDAEPSRRWSNFDAKIVSNDSVTTLKEPFAELKSIKSIDGTFFEKNSFSFYSEEALTEAYSSIFARFFRALADNSGAVLVHCAAGKDRTGVLCALVQRLVGVHLDDTMADYMKSNDPAWIELRIARFRDWLARQFGCHLDDDLLRSAVSVKPQYLDAFFSNLRSKWISTDRYFADVLGIDNAIREKIGARILT